MRRLDRYIFLQLLGPLGLGFMVYTFLLVMQFLFQSAEMIIQRGLPLSTVGELLMLVMPSTVVMTLPMSLLFAILITSGRLAADSELVAMRSCGISLLSLYRPVFLLSAILAGINLYLMLWVLPHGNHRLQQLQLEIVTQSVAQQVEPRVFNEQWDGKVLYVFDVPQGQDRWRGVFVAQTLEGTDDSPGGTEMLIADWGQVRVEESGEKLVLELEDAVSHQVDPKEPGGYRVTFHERLESVLEDNFLSSRKASISASKSIREMDFQELRRRASDPRTSPEMRNLVRVQMYKNFSIPAACLVFGLLALPLGINNRRGGKASGFTVSIGVILVYWILLSNGEEAARYGKMEPWLAMWIPNALFGVLGFVLLVRRNADKSLMLSQVDRWIREDLWAWIMSFGRWRSSRKKRLQEARQRKGEQGRGGRESGDSRRGVGVQLPGRRIVLRLPRLGLRVVNLMDRFVVRHFVSILGLVMLSGLVLYVVADLGENVDDILKNNISTDVLVDYYKFKSLQILYDISPIVILVTTLLTFSLLSRSNELTAFKALGVSLFRLSLPVIAMAFLVAAFNVYLQSEVLPASNQRVSALKDEIKGRKKSARTFQRLDRQWLFGQGRYVYHYVDYEPEEQKLNKLQVFEFDENLRLARRLYTTAARYQAEDGGWIFDSGWMVAFDGTRIEALETFDEPRLSDYPETPEYFTAEIRPPKQLSYRELQSYIADLERRGSAHPELKVELHGKIAYPAISLVMVLVALPFAFRLGRHGALYGIGLSVILGICFMALYIFFTTLGAAGALPPLLAVWSPNLVFALFAGYLFLGVRT
ncbi:MAG: LPS export ABC transporter permease LptF [Acidobacteriota bacterium]